MGNTDHTSLVVGVTTLVTCGATIYIIIALFRWGVGPSLLWSLVWIYTPCIMKMCFVLTVCFFYRKVTPPKQD